MSHYDDLVKKHGTYREFEDAVWNALGEISVKEAQDGCAAYRRDLADARLRDLDKAERDLSQPTKEPT